MLCECLKEVGIVVMVPISIGLQPLPKCLHQPLLWTSESQFPEYGQFLTTCRLCSSIFALYLDQRSLPSARRAVQEQTQLVGIPRDPKFPFLVCKMVDQPQEFLLLGMEKGGEALFLRKLISLEYQCVFFVSRVLCRKGELGSVEVPETFESTMS